MARGDRLVADLERGFAALEGGKLDTAATIVERCQRIDRKHPEVVALAAAVADARGESEVAIDQYRRLSELRPDDPMPRICLARLELHDIGDPDAALDTLEGAFEFIDEEADLIEAIYVKTEALIARGEPVSARETLGELASSVIEDPELLLDLAELAMSAEDAARATRWIEATREIAKEDKDAGLEADALHALGRVHEITGDRKAMVAAWQQVRVLDLAAPPGEVHVTEEEVERVALATLHELPEHIRDRLEKVPILIDEVPTEHVVDDGFDPRALGLFSGTPMPEDGAMAPVVTNIMLYKKNLERSARDKKHLAEEIRITVLHETAHYFGLDEDDLEALGLD